jgi:hypothetical protein
MVRHPELRVADMEVDVAEQLWRRLGRKAAATVDLCISDCQRLNDDAATRFWISVADQLQAKAGADTSRPEQDLFAHDGDPASGGRNWILMQRIERYRHRALRVEHLVARSEANRLEMIEIVAQWLELADEALRLARVAEQSDASSPPI